LRAASSSPRLSIGILAFLFALPMLPPKRPPSGLISTRKAVRFDLNRDPPQALMALPGLGPVIVGELVAAREAAPLVSLRDVDRRVRGIGPARVRAIEPFVAWPERLTAQR
jgi:hypothetical protein